MLPKFKSTINSMIRTVSLYLFIWLVLSAVYFYFSESITKKMFPGYDNVELWLIVLISGLIIISVAILFSLSVKLRKRKKL